MSLLYIFLVTYSNKITAEIDHKYILSTDIHGAINLFEFCKPWDFQFETIEKVETDPSGLTEKSLNQMRGL